MNITDYLAGLGFVYIFAIIFGGMFLLIISPSVKALLTYFTIITVIACGLAVYGMERFA